MSASWAYVALLLVALTLAFNAGYRTVPQPPRHCGWTYETSTKDGVTHTTLTLLACPQ